MKFLLPAVVLVPSGLVVAIATGITSPDVAALTGANVQTCTVNASPAPSPGVGQAPSPSAATVGGVQLSAAQMANATVIVGTVKGMGIQQLGAEIAVSTAYTESRLNNSATPSDADSVGLFQQRPSQGWGSVEELTTPAVATQKFAARMVQVPNWQTIPPEDVAQKVQISGYPDRYRTIGWPVGKPLADALWDGASGQVVCTNADNNSPSQATGPAKTALDRAYSMIGKPYCWSGGDANGPTHGTGPGCGPGAAGFDCSGLTLYAWAGQVSLPHLAADQANAGTKIPIAQDQPGDLVFWQNSTDGIHHVAMIWSASGDGHGGGQIIEAQDFGVPVHIRPFKGDLENEVMATAVRPTSQPSQSVDQAQ